MLRIMRSTSTLVVSLRDVACRARAFQYTQVGSWLWATLMAVIDLATWPQLPARRAARANQAR